MPPVGLHAAIVAISHAGPEVQTSLRIQVLAKRGSGKWRRANRMIVEELNARPGLIYSYMPDPHVECSCNLWDRLMWRKGWYQIAGTASELQIFLHRMELRCAG